MARISNQNVYITDTTISDLDSLIGTDGNTTVNTTKSFPLGRLKQYFTSGFSPETGGVLRYTEIVYTGNLYATDAAVLNNLTPVFVVDQYHVVVVNLNSAKSVLKLQNLTVGLGSPAVLTTDFIKITPSASNLGTGAKVFKELSSDDYKFRTITSTNSSVTVTENANSIDLAVVSGGGGSGSVSTVSATNGTGQTFTISNPTTTPNISLALTKSAVGLDNVDNTTDANKPVSTAQQTALNLKANLASPTFTGTVSGVTKAMVGLGNVDNTSDANKPVSTAATSAIAAKEDAANKSTTTTLGTSNTLYPTQNAVKTYVDTNIPAIVNTAFNNVAYSATITRAYNPSAPNIEIDLVGNLSLTITGTVNGDSGLLNLYFSGTQTATLNGFTNLVITGAGAMIPVYFMHDTDGIKWYKDETGGATVDTSTLALKRGTRLFHTIQQGYTVTITNVGVDCTTSFIVPAYIGFELTKTNGEKAVVATVTGSTFFTTVEPFATNSTSVVTAVAPAVEVKNDGSVSIYDKSGTKIIAINADESVNLSSGLSRNNIGNMIPLGIWKWGQLDIDAGSSSITIPAFATYTFKNGNDADLKLKRNAAGVLEILNLTDGLGDLRTRRLLAFPSSTYANDAAADADTALLAGSLYWITGDRVPRKKP